VFYEIGANNPFSSEGQQSVLKPIMPKTRFYLFEAMPKHEEALKRSKEPYVIALLGEEDGLEKIFYQSKDYAPGDGDSYYRERTDSYNPSAVVISTLRTRSLDSIVEELRWPLPDFMKIDTQGAEIDVLRGASKCLAKARGLQIECAVRRYNDGAPLLPEVISFVQAAGFRIYDVSQLHFNGRKELLQVDLLFVRDNLFDDGD
jgi:FkbM family methyltransferase